MRTFRKKGLKNVLDILQILGSISVSCHWQLVTVFDLKVSCRILTISDYFEWNQFLSRSIFLSPERWKAEFTHPTIIRSLSCSTSDILMEKYGQFSKSDLNDANLIYLVHHSRRYVKQFRSWIIWMKQYVLKNKLERIVGTWMLLNIMVYCYDCYFLACKIQMS